MIEAPDIPGEIPSAIPVEQTFWQAHPIRHLLLKAGFAAGCAAAGAVAGAGYGAFTPTDIHVGPHEATAELTLDNHMTVDTGMLGYFTPPYDSRWDVGARIEIGQIPSPPNTRPADSLGEVITQYEQLFADPAQMQHNIQKTVVTRVVQDAETGSIAGLALLGVGSLVLRSMSEKKQEAWQVVFQAETNGPSRVLTAGIIGAVILTGCAASSPTTTATDPGEVAHVFDDTPLQGTIVHGELLRLATETVAPTIVNYIDDTQKFYKQVVANFKNAYSPSVIPEELRNNKDIVLIQVISDNHCDIGEDELHGAVAEAFGVDETIDAGDITMSGQPAEAACVNAEADAIVRHNHEEDGIGNHDSSVTEKQAKAAGMIPIVGLKVITVDGLTFLGQADPRESVFGTAIHYRGKETLDDQGALLKKVACSLKTPVDFLVVHSPIAAQPTIEAGCARMSVSGDTHEEEGPNLANANGAYQFTSGTSGGVAPGKVTIGKLQADAPERVFLYNKKEHQLIGSVKVTPHPNASVDVSLYEPLSPGTGDTPPKLVVSTKTD